MSLTAYRFVRNAGLQQAARNAPALKLRDHGRGVRDLQRALIDLGFKMPLSTHWGARVPDGIFGPETEAAVKRFQAQQKLTVDGVAGKQTLERLDAIFRRNDPFYTDPVAAEARLESRMRGPQGARPFAVTTARTAHVAV